MIYSLIQILMKGSEIDDFRNLDKFCQNVSKVRNLKQGLIYVFFGKVWNLIKILWVFRVEARLTVYRALGIIQKRFGHTMDRLGQRLSIFWTKQK